MQLANIWFNLNELGSNVGKKGFTPAECQVIKRMFGYKSPGTNETSNPITHVDILKEEVERTANEEYTRLCGRYGEKLIKEMFPGENPNIPKTFKEAGFEQTAEAQPKANPKEHDRLPLAELPKGELKGTVTAADAKLVEESQKQLLVNLDLQKQIEELKKQLADKNSADKPVEPVKPTKK
jgi:hypothetical protein